MDFTIKVFPTQGLPFKKSAPEKRPSLLALLENPQVCIKICSDDKHIVT